MILSKRQNHLQRFLSRAILLFNFVNTGIVNGRRNETFNETLRDLKISVNNQNSVKMMDLTLVFTIIVENMKMFSVILIFYLYISR